MNAVENGGLENRGIRRHKSVASPRRGRQTSRARSAGQKKEAISET